MQDVYTTGDVARICLLSHQTVIRCIDSGRLQGYRVPGSQFRRVTHAELVKFMTAEGLPRDWLDEEQDWVDTSIAVRLLGTSRSYLATQVAAGRIARRPKTPLSHSHLYCRADLERLRNSRSGGNKEIVTKAR